MSETTTAVGAVLGNYRLISQISSGGMGTVYRAQHEILGRPAAVKLLRPELVANEELVERFLIEAKASTLIRHPGIVEVYDFGYTEAGFAYLVMEFLEGKSLGKALAEVERFTEWEAAAIARGIASALKAAHAQGIIHRDLKPENVFLVPDLEGVTGALRPKVLDFGIAKLTAEHSDRGHTQTGVFLGTPLYMAPEQARAASAIDHRADLYSLGCILYELLAGKPPFVSEGAGEIVALHLFAEPEPLTSLLPDISPAMNDIVMRLLAKEPADRFQSAQEVANALNAAMGGRLSNELSAMVTSGMRPVQVPTTTLRKSNGVVAAPPAVVVTDDSPTLREGRSRLPLIAGLATLLVVVVVTVILLVARGGDHEPVEANETKPIDRIETTAPPKPDPPPPVRSNDEPQPEHARALDRSDRSDLAPTPTPRKSPPTPPATPRRATIPRGPVTPNGSPIETDLGPAKKKDRT